MEYAQGQGVAGNAQQGLATHAAVFTPPLPPGPMPSTQSAQPFTPPPPPPPGSRPSRSVTFEVPGSAAPGAQHRQQQHQQQPPQQVQQRSYAPATPSQQNLMPSHQQPGLHAVTQHGHQPPQPQQHGRYSYSYGTPPYGPPHPVQYGTPYGQPYGAQAARLPPSQPATSAAQHAAPLTPRASQPHVAPYQLHQGQQPHPFYPAQPQQVSQQPPWMAGPPMTAPTTANVNFAYSQPSAYHQGTGTAHVAGMPQPGGQAPYNQSQWGAPQNTPGAYATSSLSPHAIAFQPNNGEYRRKDARATLDRIVKSTQLKPKNGDKYTFVGTAVGNRNEHPKLSIHNDPIAFTDEVRRVMQIEEGGIWAFPQDQLLSDGYTRPLPDALTPLRVEGFSKMFQPNLATRTSMRPGSTVSIYLVTGGRLRVPFEQVTATDWARLLVAEVARNPGARAASADALTNIALEAGEAWASAASRLVLNVRAKLVDPNRPFASEETYFWRLLSSTNLADLIDRTLQLFMPSQQDRLSMESHVLGVNKRIEKYIAPWAIDITNPTEPHMVARGDAIKHIHTEFVSDLANRKSTYYSITDLTGATTRATPVQPGSAMGAISLKRPLDETTLATPAKRRPRRNDLLGALEELLALRQTGNSTCDEDEGEDMEQAGTTVAAFTNKLASIPGRNGTPFITKDTTRPDATRSRDTRGTRKSSSDDEEEELPEPDDSQTVITRALRKRRVCFYHARGVSCPHQERTSNCRFSHDERVVPYGHYKLPEKQEDTVFAISPVERVQLEMTRAYSGQWEADS